MKIKIYYGGWYQRTTLHLSEIYDFLKRGHSNLDLDKRKLELLRNGLGLVSVSRENDYFEYVLAKNDQDIEIKYFEDGLYLLSIESEDLLSSKEKIESYFKYQLSPSISYIFSLGAPTPKVLANITNAHPFVVAVETKNHLSYEVDIKVFGEVYSTIKSKDYTVFKTPGYIIIAVNKNKIKDISNLVEMQIFFREFKDQLDKYLNIHRKIWEDITKIKEMGSIRGKDISINRMNLDSYDRSINLINNRINQMGSYVKTRQAISKELDIESNLTKLFDYKFETLMNTLSYVKEVWAMTKDYVKNVISVLSDIENQSLNNSIKSLQIITSIGVVSGIFGYLTRSEIPKITNAGWQYLMLLIVSTVVVNLLVIVYYRSIKYKLKISGTSNSI